jgi:hypothetical protein
LLVVVFIIFIDSLHFIIARVTRQEGGEAALDGRQ